MRKSRPVPKEKTNKKTKNAEEKWYGPPALEKLLNEDVRDQYGYDLFSKTLAELSEKFLAGELNAKEMIERAYYDDGAGPGDGLIVDYDPSSGIVNIESGGSSLRMPASEAIEKFARRYVEELLISAKYYRGRIKLYRGIDLVNPEDFDPTEVGQSWTPIKSAAKPYFGFHKYYSRKLERTYSRTSDAESYVLIALVPVESVDWYYTLMRALSFGISDEKEIVLKTGAPIELIDIPMGLSFAIDATPEALIRAAEISDEGYCSECGEHWTDIGKHPCVDDYVWSEESKRKLLDIGPLEECWNCYAQFENFNEDEFDYYTHMFTQDVVDGQTVKKYVDSIHDGYFSWWDALDDLEFTLQKVPLSVWDNIERSEVDGQWIDAPVYSHRLSNTLLQFRNQHPDDYPPVVLKLDESGNYEVIDGFHRLNALQILGRDSVRAWVGINPKKKTKKAEEKWYGPPALEAIMNEDDNGRRLFEHKYQKVLAVYESYNPHTADSQWFQDVEMMEMMGDDLFSWQLNYRLNQLYPHLAFPTTQEDYDRIKLENPEIAQEEEEIARTVSDDMLTRVYEMLFQRNFGKLKTQYQDGKLLLYREINMEDPADLNMAKAGIFWTPVLSAAEAHWGGKGNPYLLSALVDFEDINWGASWYANLICPEEYEIRLEPGAQIEILPLTVWSLISGFRYVYPEEIIYEVDAPNPNILAVERGTETELLEAMKDLPEEYQRLMGILEVEPQPTKTAFASEEDEVVLYHGTAAANIESILQEGLMPTGGWSVDSNQTGVFLTPHPDGATSWARWSAMKAIEPESKGASVGETRKFYSMMARLRMQESDAVAILEVRIPKDCYQDLYCDVADLIDSGILIGDSYEDLDVSQWDACMQNGIDLVFEGGAIPPEWISVLPWQEDWVDSYWSSVIADMIAEHGEDYFGAEDIDLTVGEAFDTALAEIRADVDSIQPRSKDLSDVTFEDYNMANAVYQSFMVPAGITGDIVRDEWYDGSEPIYLWSDIFTLPEGSAGEEWKQKIDAQRTEKESDILASNEINYAFYWYAIMQINSIYNMLLFRLGERKMYTGVNVGPPVELPEIIESQRDSTDIEIYRWLATSQGDEPVRRSRNRMRPVDLNYYGGYADVDRIKLKGTGDTIVSVPKGLEALSYGPCWSLSPDAYTRTDQWRLTQEDVIHKENEKVGISLKRKLMDEEVNTRTYVIEKSIPASGVDWYSTLISSALWMDEPEYEVIPKRGVFLSEEITDKSDFEQAFDEAESAARSSFEEYGWFGAADLNDVSDLYNDAAGRERLRDVERHLAMLKRPGSLLWSSGDDSAYDAYPDDLRDPTYIFQDSGIFVDEDGKTDGYTDEERGETYEEGESMWGKPKSPDLDIRLRYSYTLNCISKLAEQYFDRLIHLKNHLKPQFASGEVTLYRAFSLPEGEVPELRRMTVFPLSMRIGNARRMENKEQRVKYTYESYGEHWSFLPGFEWSDDFPSHYGKPYIMEKQIPYTDVDWFTTLLVMAYGREVEYEVAVNENVFLAENEVKIPLYHVTPLDQVGSILTTGLEPRIGPRSEGMELEPRVYLFGIKESMQDSFIWEEMLDEKYADEWRSGYAVLRIDLPIDWFQDRRVEKTFHPDGPEPSWEWSTLETIPGEYLKVEEEWEWNEDDITRYFQADFGMPVYGKHRFNPRNQAELDLATLSDDYKYFHLSWDRFVIDKDSKSFTFTPRVPENPFGGFGAATIEDDFTPRVSLSPTVKGCLEALPDDEDGTWYVYGTKQSDNIISVQEYFEDCPEGYGQTFNLLNWINSLPLEDQAIIKNYDYRENLDLSGKYARINVSDLPQKYRDMFYGCVPDALQHDEYWSLEPITMDYLGYITWGTLGPSGINQSVYFSEGMEIETVAEPHLYLETEYPLRLYHGTSVRNWRDIQASGEFRTGCLASSHGYDIEMPATFIDLAIEEIDDIDINADGVVLKITFPSKAVADQYLEADTNMYDLGMAVLEDDLYSRYAPVDWKPANTFSTSSFFPMNWFETDFQDLVKSNQATKTIPYYPQDRSDWQASYFSVYSVCIKQPIPMEYITVDWGSDSMGAESEDMKLETVSESWSKAVKQWKEIVDWAQQHGISAHREDVFVITPEEFEQALEIYNKIITVASIVEISYPFRDMDKDAKYLIPEITTDSKVAEIFRRQLDSIWDGFVDGIYMESMNHYVYYWILDWIKKLNTGLSAGVWRGQELNNIIHTQGRRTAIKAYRWITLPKGQLPSITHQPKDSKTGLPLTYGQHWSLHPNAFKETDDWFGMSYGQQEYLIEKEVPVEDIDWFRTLISCLFFKDAEFEIIMNPMTYIAETIDSEEESSKTVGEEWDKALIEWYEIVDWAKQEQETGLRDISTTEFQQAIEVYNKLQPVANKIGEPYFLGGSSDETIIEQLVKTYASDDLELEKTLIEHYEELHILTIPYVVKSKTMNYFFYYGLIEWIRMMNWRLTSINSYGGKELDDSISSQFQESTLKAYRWVSVRDDELPSRSISRRNYQFSYGAHWSLHPEIYTWTNEWEGVQAQQNYLIEKEVPVEDIDWFATLVSCLLFIDNPELEIIMNPMTYIAETIEEPHLYLDMDGCFADFAGAITQRVNDVLQVQDVSNIPSKSLRRAARKAKVLGITSVSESDFDLSSSHDPVRKKVIDRMMYKIASEPGFFYNLEVMNRDILEEIIASGRPFSFLSAPIGGTNDYSIEDKREWVRDRLGLDVAVNVVPREEKITFCYPGDILIDDHATTIAEWSSAGGRGILFPQEIESFLRKPYNGETTTNVAEEVNNVNQYPIMYKKTAIGTLQQWQVLLLPQESGGYLLTTASGKVDGAITQGRGKLITEGKVNRTALEQAELEANSKFKKKQDEGYFETKDEAMNNLVVLPMLAHNFEKRSHDIRYPAVAQRKFDGVRCLAITQADGSVRLMTRKGKDFAHLNHLRDQIKALNIEPNMVLDGEVYSDSLTFQEATGLVRRQTLKPGDIEKMEQIDYRLYDAILLDRPEATFLDRYSKLAALFPTSSSVEGRRMGNLVLTENFPLRGPEDIMSLHSQFTGDEEFEGVMIRNLHGTYDLNKRSKHLQKFKTFQDAEYEIIGYTEASGNDQGTVVWIVKTAIGQEFRVRPEGTRESRREYFENGDDYIGKMLTVKFFELTDDGVPRFPVGIAIRDYE
jgi:DNA ligase-1